MSGTPVRVHEGVTVYVAGGLGNQLFQLAAGWEQAARLGCSLYLDVSHTRVAGTWTYALGPLAHPGRVLDRRESPWTSRRFSSRHVYPVPRRIGAVQQRVRLERDAAVYDPEIDSIRSGTFLVGYFQSALYFSGIAAAFEVALREAGSDPDEEEYLQQLRDDPRTTLHLRRGDYLAAPGQPLVASVDYAMRAANLLRDLGESRPLRVFSDSIDVVRGELDGRGLDIEFADESRLNGPFGTLRAMAAGRGMIMSNSTFSWWAAWLMRGADPQARIVAPRPWNESGSARADRGGRDWIGLDARPGRDSGSRP